MLLREKLRVHIYSSQILVLRVNNSARIRKAFLLELRFNSDYEIHYLGVGEMTVSIFFPWSNVISCEQELKA